MTQDAETALFAFLNALNIAHATHEHPAVFTVEESRGLHDDHPGGHTKNLFLKDKKGQLFLATIAAERQTDLRFLEKAIGARGRCSFGKPELLQDVLGVAPGSVTALALINDRPGADQDAPRVTFAIDKALLSEDVVYCHPLRNTASTALAPADLLAFVSALGRTPIVVDFDAQPEPA